MMNIYLIGAGGHCVSCIDVIRSLDKFDIKGIFDVPEKIGSKVLDIPVIGTDADIKKFVSKQNYFLITVGQIKSPALRIKLYNKLKEEQAQFATVVSTRAYVSKQAAVGEGSIVMHDALVNAGASIGKNCIINTKALVEHGAVVEDHCHISTGAIVNGDCVIGQHSFVGSNSVLKESLVVPSDSVLAAGSFHR